MKNTIEQSIINRLTFKAISVVSGEWVEGHPFLAAFGQIGLAQPMEYTNVLATKGDDMGIHVMATDFFCTKVYPITLSQSLDICAQETEDSEPVLLFENDIVEFERESEKITAYIDLVAGSYILFRINPDKPDDDEFICYIDEYAAKSDDLKTVLGFKVLGNLFDEYYSEDFNLNTANIERRDFAKMIYDSGGSKHLS